MTSKDGFLRSIACLAKHTQKHTVTMAQYELILGTPNSHSQIPILNFISHGGISSSQIRCSWFMVSEHNANFHCSLMCLLPQKCVLSTKTCTINMQNIYSHFIDLGSFQLTPGPLTITTKACSFCYWHRVPFCS